MFHNYSQGAFLDILSVQPGYSEPRQMNLTRWVSWIGGATVHQDLLENATNMSTKAGSHVDQGLSENVAEQQIATDQSSTAADVHRQWPENAIEPQDESDQTSVEADSYTQTIISDTTQVEASRATDFAPSCHRRNGIHSAVEAR